MELLSNVLYVALNLEPVGMFGWRIHVGHENFYKIAINSLFCPKYQITSYNTQEANCTWDYQLLSVASFVSLFVLTELQLCYIFLQHNKSSRPLELIMWCGFRNLLIKQTSQLSATKCASHYITENSGVDSGTWHSEFLNSFQLVSYELWKSIGFMWKNRFSCRFLRFY
jgi:hypothetical protein